jgi:inorganic phosphate transporter, PiT family
VSNGAAVTLVEVDASKPTTRIGRVLTVIALGVGVVYVAGNLVSDLSDVHIQTLLPFVLLGAALAVALGFEFVNGFHDTANAVATVIYTHALPAPAAVVWSGIWNFLGVLTSSGMVAFTIVSLLPVELILQVGSSTGFAMVFALLVAATIWNLGTWYFGLPSSSSHTLIGSIIGVGLANQMMAARTGTSGVDWAQAAAVGRSLLLSPMIGFGCAALLLLTAKWLLPRRELYDPPLNNQPPPLAIRGLLILTCTGVSFAHGSNDGQKGMGLIMLILIGTVPTAYALNRAAAPSETRAFVAVSQQAVGVLDRYATGPRNGDAREQLTAYLRSRTPTPQTLPALRQIIGDVANELGVYEELRKVPIERVSNVRNDLYVVSETLQLMRKTGRPAFAAADGAALTEYKRHVDAATKFIPAWVKVAVAIALGLGTMIGWKRIVVTVGERIGKSHLSYAQGAAAEITAMITIGAADTFGVPVSTTHVLSSGIAGTMAANRSGVQGATIRNLLVAWVLTLPASMLLAGGLFWLFRAIAGVHA